MKEFSISFFNRNFSTKVFLNKTARVTRYSWNMKGGPKLAYLSIPTYGDALELLGLLRCPVVIEKDMKPVWWGIVNKVTVPHGAAMRIGKGLDAMYNYVIADWSLGSTNGTTTAATDVISQGEMGVKEMRLNLANTTSDEAEATRDQYLENHKYPMDEVEFSGGSNDVQIECKGYYDVLDWHYYVNAGTGDHENAFQLAAIIQDSLGILAGYQIEDASGLTSTETRDGKSTALRYVEALLDAGTTNLNPLLATVDKDRYVHVYERTAEPIEGHTDYVLKEDGNIVSNIDGYIPPEWCICAKWVTVKGAVSTLTGMTKMRPFFIESAEYNAQTDLTTYKFADSYEQHRLAKWVESIASHTPSSLPSTPSGNATYYIDKKAYSGNLTNNADTNLSLTEIFTETNASGGTPPAGYYEVHASFEFGQVAAGTSPYASAWFDGTVSDAITFQQNYAGPLSMHIHSFYHYTSGTLWPAVHVQQGGTSLSAPEGGGFKAIVTVKLLFAS